MERLKDTILLWWPLLKLKTICHCTFLSIFYYQRAEKTLSPSYLVTLSKVVISVCLFVYVRHNSGLPWLILILKLARATGIFVLKKVEFVNLFRDSKVYRHSWVPRLVLDIYIPNSDKKKTRSRNIIWFNPPFRKQ